MFFNIFHNQQLFPQVSCTKKKKIFSLSWVQRINKEKLKYFKILHNAELFVMNLHIYYVFFIIHWAVKEGNKVFSNVIQPEIM